MLRNDRRMKPSLPKMIVITGPTASGKSALAVELAQRLGTEIISADSRQVFQGIPIVTAMPTPEERDAVKHHLIDMLPLDAYYSASMFEEDALRLAKPIMEERGSVVVCGGSMMYVDALCNGIDQLPTVPEKVRAQLMKRWDAEGNDWLLEELYRLDIEYYKKVDLRNLKRVFHAIEISITAGAPYSSLITGRKRKREFPIIKLCLDGERDELFRRINLRVDKMIAAGIEDEARRVYPLKGLNSLNTVGLKEMFAWFDGEMDRTTAIERIKKNTRVYAKKQLTWFKKDPDIFRLDIGSKHLIEDALSFFSF